MSACAQVHHPPYLFEAFLVQPIDDEGSTARLSDRSVLISLPKKTPGLWKDLLTEAGMYFSIFTLASDAASVGGRRGSPELTDQTEEEVEITSSSVPGEEATKAMRERALLNYREKLSSESRLRAENKRAESRYALKTTMKVTAGPSP